MKVTEQAVLETIKELSFYPQKIRDEAILEELLDKTELQFVLAPGLGILISDAEMETVHTVRDLVDRCLL